MGEVFFWRMAVLFDRPFSFPFAFFFFLFLSFLSLSPLTSLLFGLCLCVLWCLLPPSEACPRLVVLSNPTGNFFFFSKFPSLLNGRGRRDVLWELSRTIHDHDPGVRRVNGKGREVRMQRSKCPKTWLARLGCRDNRGALVTAGHC
jgi:hypothetical protein